MFCCFSGPICRTSSHHLLSLSNDKKEKEKMNHPNQTKNAFESRVDVESKQLTCYRPSIGSATPEAKAHNGSCGHHKVDFHTRHLHIK
jgi:hypothetical protein